MVNRFQQPNPFKKHLDIFFFSQNRCRSKPNLSGLHAFRLKGIICFNLQRISPTKVFSLGIFKLFRFKGETMTNFRKLLPNWPISWRFSGLLNFKGNILEKNKLSSCCLSDILGLRERLGTTF